MRVAWRKIVYLIRQLAIFSFIWFIITFAGSLIISRYFDSKSAGHWIFYGVVGYIPMVIFWLSIQAGYFGKWQKRKIEFFFMLIGIVFGKAIIGLPW